MAAPCITREEQISALVPHVHKIARFVQQKTGLRHIDQDELIGAGYEAIVRAYDNFDPSRGTSYPAHAKHRAVFAMLNAIRSLNPVPERAQALIRHGEAFAFDFAAANGRMPTQAEIEAHLPGYIAALAKANEIAQVSLDNFGEDDIEAQIPDPVTTEDAALARERERTTEALIDALSEKQRTVIRCHYFLNRPLTVVARALGMRPDYASYLHRKALTKMRRLLGS